MFSSGQAYTGRSMKHDSKQPGSKRQSIFTTIHICCFILEIRLCQNWAFQQRLIYGLGIYNIGPLCCTVGLTCQTSFPLQITFCLRLQPQFTKCWASSINLSIFGLGWGVPVAWSTACPTPTAERSALQLPSAWCLWVCHLKSCQLHWITIQSTTWSCLFSIIRST